MVDRLSEPRETPLFQRLAIIGVGHIGSSIAHVARRQNLAETIVAFDASAQVSARVAELQLADNVAPSLEASVIGADLVILCAPVGATAAIADVIAPHLAPGAIVSDVGSVKSAVVAALKPRLPDFVHLVPAHPVAGTEHSGPDAGFATLFVNRWCILDAASKGRTQGLSASACVRSGRRRDRMSRSCRRRITT